MSDTGVGAAAYVPRLVLERPARAARAWREDATLVFLDISGFTSLSEQLARRGREGAEELVSTLTRVFTALLAASDDGGDVVKFAGDAMLVRFVGTDHVLRACHAAAAVQRVLRAVGSVHLAGARARLRMSVGVHTGPVDYLLTGAEQRSLVVTGPVLDAVLDLESAARPGEVLVSAEVAALLPPRATSVGPPGVAGRRLSRMPSVPGRPSGPVTVQVPVEEHLPAVFVRRPDLLRADSDHRRAAVGFLHVTGLGAVPPELRLDRVDALTAIVDAACAEAGVNLLDTDVARDGYRYFLTAGAPLTTEDPDGRLLRALRQVLDRAAAVPGLEARAGATAGRVFAGPAGSAARRAWSAMGDPTNLAARITARAAPGELLALPALPRRALLSFDTEPVAAMTLRGKSEPVPLVRVIGVGGVRGRTDAEQPFVGRADELAALAAALARVGGGAGGVVEVTGEAGLGKTRLADEAAARSGLPIVRHVFDPFRRGTAYGALREIVRPLLGLVADDDPQRSGEVLSATVAERAPDLLPWLPLLAPVVGAEVPATAEVADLDDRFRAARSHDALGVLLDVLLAERTLLVLHDAQWVDATSAEALAAVLAAPHPWGALLTRRDAVDRAEAGDVVEGLAAPSGSTVLPLGPLPDADARTLAAAAAGRARRPAELRALVGRASGNPYFLLELTTVEADRELPGSVEELVALRIDDLDGDERDLLRQAAALGGRFLAPLFTRVTGRSDLVDAARGGLAPFLEVEEPADGPTVVRFRRELHREVAYDQLTFRRRREHHAAAVAALTIDPQLAGGDPLPLLSMHASEAGLWPEAYLHSRAAAHAARDQWANEEAIVLARRALEAGRRCRADEGELRELRLLVGDAAVLAGRQREAIAAFRAARTGSRDPAVRALLTERIAMASRGAGDLDRALSAARDLRRIARDLSEPQRLPLLAEADLVAAGVRHWQGRSAQARRLANSAAGLAEQVTEPATRTRLLARAWALHDTAVVELEGRLGDHGERPLRMFAEIGDLYNQGRFAANVAAGHHYAGDWRRAVELHRESLDLATRIGDVFAVAVAQMNIGEVLALQGHGAEAVALLEEAVAGLRAHDAAIAEAGAETFLGLAHRVAGDLDAAEDAFLRARGAHARAGGTHVFMLDDLATRELELLVDRGDDRRVVEAADELLTRGDAAALHQLRALRSRGTALRRRGETDAAARDLARSADLARAAANPYEEGCSRLAAGDVAAARRLLEPLDVVVREG